MTIPKDYHQATKPVILSIDDLSEKARRLAGKLNVKVHDVTCDRFQFLLDATPEREVDLRSIIELAKSDKTFGIAAENARALLQNAKHLREKA